jgi:transposase
MMHLPASVRVYPCTSACDVRTSFDGLHALVTQSMDLDAFAGHLFVFSSRRRDRIRILYWDRDGIDAMPFGESADKRGEITAAQLGAFFQASI